MTKLRTVDPDRSRGILLGAAVGDALGWPQEDRNNIVGGRSARDVPPRPEFRAWERNAGTQFARYVDPVGAGAYSDDTQLLLAVARACERGDEWLRWLTEVELPIWPLYQRGGGRAVLSASRAWADGRPPWIPGSTKDADKTRAYFSAGANGVAMRIAPHALLSPGDSSTLIQRILADGIATHGHPRALVGAAVHGLALRYALMQQETLGYGGLLHAVLEDKVWQDDNLLNDVLPPEWHDRFRALNGDTVATLWHVTVEEMTDLLRMALDALAAGAMADDEKVLGEMGCFDKKRNGAGTITAAAALYLVTRSAARPLNGLIRAAYLQNADTDTLASLTASLHGAVHGPAWLGPLARSVQDSEYIARVGTVLALQSEKPDARPSLSGSWPDRSIGKGAYDLRTTVFDGGTNPSLPDGTPLGIHSRYELPTRANAIVERVVCESSDGQTLVFDKISRGQRAHTDPSGLRSHEEEASSKPQSLSTSQTQSPTSTDTEATVVAGIHLLVRDLKKSADFYGQTLGLPCRLGAHGVAQVGKMLVLHQAAEADKLGRTDRLLLSLQVPDLQAVRRRLAEGGYPHDASFSDGRVLQIRDLDGYLIHLRSI